MATPAIARTDQIFPKLTKSQIDRIATIAQRKRISAGDVLFRPGDTGIPFFVLLSGALDILHVDGAREETITVHKAGHFTGEINMFSNRRNLVLGRMKEAGEVLSVAPEQFRGLLAQDAELSELVMRAFILRRVSLIEQGQSALTVIGSAYCGATLRVRRFLSRNGQPYRYIDMDTDEASEGVLQNFEIGPDDVPIVVLDNGEILRSPLDRELAAAVGLAAPLDSGTVFDTIVVGAGPGGLAAAVYAASEGLNTLVLEPIAPGGQAGTSSKIENYLGFPTGISGQALAGRARTQAEKFGARIEVSRAAQALDCSARPYVLTLSDGEQVRAQSVVLACGARYRKLPLPRLEEFEGRGVNYAATAMEGGLCGGTEVVVVGGGNSAGQAAVFLSGKADHVHLMVRSDGLAATMSQYLAARIDASSHITLHTHAEIEALDGNGRLERVRWRDNRTGDTMEREIRQLFLMIGADPNTDWLGDCLALDAKGFVRTGPTAAPETWPLERPPSMLETSQPGIFAVGDVRSDSVKRVASAVGEGAMSVQFLHRTLTE